MVLILLTGAFLRLYKIEAYMTFLGDEGRDALIVSRFIKHFDLMLIGPGTSIGNMYLGPLYYYLIAPSLLLAGFSPVGPSVFVALVGVATVFLVWRIGREFFSEAAGLVAAAFYAVAPTVIVYSRSSWNPNIMPFFALLVIYSIWRVWNRHEYKWLIVLGVAYAFVLQSHYLGLLLTPVILIFWYLSRVPIRYTLYASVLFLFLMSPLVIFDARHGWRNYAAVKTFFTVRQETVSIKPWRAIPKVPVIFNDVNISLLTGKDKNTGIAISVILALAVLICIKKVKRNKGFWLLFSWFGFALVGLGLYKQQIYDHYYGFFFAAPFLLLGVVASQVSRLKIKNKIVKIFPLVIFLYLFLVNLKNLPLWKSPNQQLKRAKEVAAKIAEESKGERFNLAVIAERNYEDGYQYFLEKDGLPVVEIDAQVKESITGQLFVVCEMVPEKCDPTHSPKAEVANFGWSKIKDSWEVFGTRLFRLVHTK